MLDVDVPTNVTATVAIPNPGGAVNYVGVGAGAPKKVGQQGDRTVFTVGSGSTHFSIGAEVPGGVGGTVPPTLSLQLGAAASFGAFTPGVARDYTASTSANVVSTAGDATLSVSDPSTMRPAGSSTARSRSRDRCRPRHDRRVRRAQRRAAHADELVRARLQRRRDDRLPAVDRRQRPAAHRHLRQDADVHVVDDESINAATRSEAERRRRKYAARERCSSRAVCSWLAAGSK